MPTVSPSQSNPGDTIEASDINTPVNQLAAVINGGIDSTNIAANGVTTTNIADSNVTESKLTHRPSEYLPNHIASGCIVTQSSGASWSMTSGVVYMNGSRLAVSSTTGTATLSKDTYFDLLDNGNGTVSLVNTSGNIVTNGASSPSLASNSLRIAVVVTSASTITEVKRGIFDSNGVSVYNAARLFLRITGGPAVSSIQTLVDGSTNGIVSYGNVPMDWDGTSNLSLYTMLRTAGTGNTKTNRTAYRMRNAATIATLEAAVDAPNTFSTTNIQVTRQIAYAASNFAKGDVIRLDYQRVGADGFDTLAAGMDVDGIWIEYSKKYNV